MAEDIAPALLEAIRRDFAANLGGNERAAALLEQIQAGGAGYAQAGDYAEEVGRALADAFAAHLSSAALPDGRMYWNIADRVIRPLLEEDHNLAAQAAQTVQQQLNEAAGLGLRAQQSEVDAGRIDGLLNKLCAAEQYDDAAWVLAEPVITFSRAAVDETLRRNAEFQAEAGLQPRIIRRAEAGCCKWCRSLAGSYRYPRDVPEEVYQRHNRCRCVVEYDPDDGGGLRQNVHTKRWTADAAPDKIEERKRLRLSSDVFRVEEYRKANSLKGDEAARADWAKAKDGGRHRGVYWDAMHKSKAQLQRSIISHTEQVERHADKIAHPEQYDIGWADKTQVQREGLLKKWRKDMERNSQQANVEIYTWEERFGNGSE